MAFLAAIAAPGIRMIVRPSTEVVTTATGELQPPLEDLLEQSDSTLDALRIFNSWFRTRFGFREALIEAGAVLRVRGLGISTSSLVLLGEDRWLFYAGERSVDSFRHAQPFTAAELWQWEQIVAAWLDICRRAGSRLILLVPPDKATVYPELMPAWATLLAPQSRLDQLRDVFAGRDDFDFVDVRPAFAEMRRTGVPLYYRTDTHWNELGAYIASREVGRVLARHFPSVTVPLVANPRISTARHGGDLARFLGLRKRLTDEEVHLDLPVAHASVKNPWGTRFSRDMQVQVRVVSSRPDAPIARVHVLRDSFSGALIPFVAEYFGSGVYEWTTRLDATEVETTRPDVVIVEIVERYLMKDPLEILAGK